MQQLEFKFKHKITINRSSTSTSTEGQEKFNEFNNAEKIFHGLRDKGIVIRDRRSAVPNCLRITVGTPEENDKLLSALNALSELHYRSGYTRNVSRLQLFSTRQRSPFPAKTCPSRNRCQDQFCVRERYHCGQ